MCARKVKPTPKLDSRTIWNAVRLDEWHELLAELAPDLSFKISKNHIRGTCPKHGGDSFWFTPSKGLIKCYGCDWYEHNPVNFIATLAKENFSNSAARLKKRFRSLRSIISDENVAALDAAARTQTQRDAIVRFCCNQLHEAIQLYPDPTAMVNAHLLYAKPAIDWLHDRRFGDSPGAQLSPDARKEVLMHLCEQRLIGVLPATATISNTFGAASEELRQFRSMFDSALEGARCVGHMIFPWHRVEGGVGRIKIRSPFDNPDGTKNIETVDPVDRNVGFYGLNAIRPFFDSALPLTTVRIVEGEPSVLQLAAQMFRDPNYLDPVIACGGMSSPSLDSLAAMGIETICAMGDDDDGGMKNIERWAGGLTTDAISLKVFKWPANVSGKDPDDVIKTSGFDAWWTMIHAPKNWVTLRAWLVEETVQLGQRYAGDLKRLAAIAREQGSLLRDPQEIRAFCRDVAAALGIDASLLERHLIKIDNETDYIESLTDALRDVYAVLGTRDGEVDLWHKEQRISLHVPIDDSRGQTQALAPIHGDAIDMVPSLIGEATFLVGDALDPEASAFNVTMKAKKYREYLNYAVSRLAMGATSLQHVRTYKQGVHYIDDANAYFVNGSDVYHLTFAGDEMAVTRLEAPVHNGNQFDVSGTSWFAGLGLDDLKLDVSLSDLYARVYDMVNTGWGFKHGQVDVTYVAATITCLAIASALRRQPTNFVTGEFQCGKSKFASGLIGGTDFPRINIVASAISMSDYSEAGLRQRQEGSPITIVLDEFEDGGRDERKNARVTAILETLRNLISERPVEKTVGTRGGEGARVYRLRFPLWCVAIRKLTDAASLSRFVVLELEKDPKRGDPVDMLMDKFGDTEIARTRRELAVGLLRHMPRLRELEGEMRTLLAQTISGTRFYEALAPAAAMLALVREDAARRGETTHAPDAVAFARAFAATREPDLRQQDDSTLSRQLFDAILAAPVESGGFVDREIKTVRQILATTSSTKQLTRGLYYDDKGRRLVIAWAEVGSLLAPTTWRGDSAMKLRQIAERDPSHVNDENVVDKLLKSLTSDMGLGHKPGQVSVFDVSTFVGDLAVKNARVVDMVRAPGVDVGSPRTAVCDDSMVV